MTNTNNHTHNIEECKNIFISWQWMIGIVVMIVSSITVLSYAAGQQITKIEQNISILTKNNDYLITDCTITKSKIEKLERVNLDIDTIKLLLRRK